MPVLLGKNVAVSNENFQATFYYRIYQKAHLFCAI